MSNLCLRPASEHDAPALQPLLLQLGYDTACHDIASWIGQCQPQQDRIWVAEHGGKLAGVITLHLMALFHSAEILARVTALVVDEAARGQGIARQLLAVAEQAAREAGARRMEITSSNYRQPAHAFYRAQGYAVPDVTRFIKPL